MIIYISYGFQFQLYSILRGNNVFICVKLIFQSLYIPMFGMQIWNLLGFPLGVTRVFSFTWVYTAEALGCPSQSAKAGSRNLILNTSRPTMGNKKNSYTLNFIYVIWGKLAWPMYLPFYVFNAFKEVCTYMFCLKAFGNCFLLSLILPYKWTSHEYIL